MKLLLVMLMMLFASLCAWSMGVSGHEQLCFYSILLCGAIAGEELKDGEMFNVITCSIGVVVLCYINIHYVAQLTELSRYWIIISISVLLSATLCITGITRMIFEWTMSPLGSIWDYK